ncbi:MAG TPA: hypothetical protein VG942_18795 [Hyphomonadaceae bacterium]|nr:hypothetical protein [Hyphomonadaceae bacterium]
MIRLVAIFAAALAFAGAALAQTAPSPETLQKLKAPFDRMALLNLMIQQGGVPIPPIPTGASIGVAKATLTVGLERVRAHRPTLDRLKAQFDALPPLQPSGLHSVDETAAMAAENTRMSLAAEAQLSLDYDAYATAMLKDDTATANKLRQKIETASFLTMENAITALRMQKITVALGDPVESAKIELTALPLDAQLSLVKLGHSAATQADTAGRMKSIAGQIRETLPLARSRLAQDPRSKVDDPNEKGTLARVNRAQWKVLDEIEGFAGFLDTVTARLSGAPLGGAEYDQMLDNMAAHTHAIRLLLEQGGAVMQQPFAPSAH